MDIQDKIVLQKHRLGIMVSLDRIYGSCPEQLEFLIPILLAYDLEDVVNKWKENRVKVICTGIND